MHASFSAATRAWFDQAFARPTPVQKDGWRAIAAGEHALLLAPTGSGKTLAAFLWAIDRLLVPPPSAAAAPAGVRVLYISPLKALAYDIERNLRAPLVGVARQAASQGLAVRAPRIGMRSGDTSAQERRALLRDPPEILVTTPESLYLMLTSQAADGLAHVHTLIVDEVHALAPSKRGVHLALSLERLGMLCAGGEPQRIGLSATVRPPEEAARFLGGQRPVTIVDRSQPPRLALKVVVPVDDMTAVTAPPEPARGGPVLSLAAEQPAAAPEVGGASQGMWAALYPTLMALLQAHRQVIIFVNSRAVCERVAQRLNALSGVADWVRAHHGSLALARRREIEEALKGGSLRGIVATSSLELGIDMGAVDLVVLVSSPGSVARGLQRIGRAGHGVGQKSAGVMLPKHPADLLECAAVAERMRQAVLEPIVVPRNCLDVLAQQLVAHVCRAPSTAAQLGEWVRRAYAYHNLSPELFHALLEMLSGSYPSDAFADLRPLLAWDRASDLLTPRRGARLMATTQAGTIPDRGMFGVFLVGGGSRVGELDEEMVYESRRGDIFTLGASSWRVEEIKRDRVLVTPAPGEPGRTPFWRGDGPGRPVELGGAMGALVRRLDGMAAPEARRILAREMGLDAKAAGNLTHHLRRQTEAAGALPTDRQLVVERFRDEMGDWQLCVLSLWGARVHAPWALALEAQLSRRLGCRVEATYNDDGITVRVADGDTPPGWALLSLCPAEVEADITAALADSALFASVFRENAGRALLLPGRRVGGRTPLWQQRLKSKMLLAAAQRYASFPIVLETYRHCLRDIFDVPALVALLESVARREIRVVEVETTAPSPFARGLAYAYQANYLYERDAPLAERRAQALTLDQGLLRELLGEAHLRALLDSEAIAAVEAELQGLAGARQAEDAEGLWQLLRTLGDLDLGELQARARAPGEEVVAWLADLAAQRRVVEVGIAGSRRTIAVGDAVRYREALGVVVPSGLPHSHLTADENPLRQLVARFARHRGPFVLDQLVARYGLGAAVMLPILQALTREGALLAGALSPQREEPEWCDAGVMRRIKRATLARVRGQVAAVEARAYAAFLPRWHGLEAPRAGLGALRAVLERLEGLSLPWSAWQRRILPSRVADFHPDMLDMLCATGHLVWQGAGALGARDGRVRLVRRARAALLLAPPPGEPAGAAAAPDGAHARILAFLARRGASFTVELGEAAALSGQEALEEVLWDLIWAGQITCDTVQPLRALAAPRRPQSRRRGGVHGGGGGLFGGRWSRVDQLLDPAPAPTLRRHAQAHMLLERWGVVSREMALWEELPGGFHALYDVLSGMEEQGALRRGHFVEGLGGAQFALGNSVEDLRAGAAAGGAPGEAAVQAIAAADPANAYGGVLPWPPRSRPEQRPPRRTGDAWVLLHQGELWAHLELKQKSLTTFAALLAADSPYPALVAGMLALSRLATTKTLYISLIDGGAALTSPLAEPLLAAGMVRTFDGLCLHPA